MSTALIFAYFAIVTYLYVTAKNKSEFVIWLLATGAAIDCVFDVIAGLGISKLWGVVPAFALALMVDDMLSSLTNIPRISWTLKKLFKKKSTETI